MYVHKLSQIFVAGSVLCAAFAANAETHGDYSFDTLRRVTNSRVGEIIDVTFKVSAFAKEGMASDSTVEDVVTLCKSIASFELNSYIKYSGEKFPNYFSITLRKGGSLYIYATLYFKGNMDCIPQELDTLN
jgi:hypothetical protein